MICIKFIFPKNYKTTGKLFGFIDLGFALFLFVLSFTLFWILRNLYWSVHLKTVIFIIIVFPVFIFGMTQTSNENFFVILLYLFLFFIKPSLYLFSKNSRDYKCYITNIKNTKLVQIVIKQFQKMLN